MTTYVILDNKFVYNDDVKKYDLGLESQNQDRIYLPFASYKGGILARAYEVIYWSTYREGLWRRPFQVKLKQGLLNSTPSLHNFGSHFLTTETTK